MEDTTAFVETLEVEARDKHAEKLRQRLAKSEIALLKAVMQFRHLERTVQSLERDEPDAVSPGTRVALSADDLHAVRMRLAREREHISAMRARHETLEREVRSYEGRVKKHRTYRLHSSEHHVDCSASQFDNAAARQRTTPLWITTTDGQRWWWFHDRFWWDSRRLSADEVRIAVLAREREQGELKELRDHELAAALGRSTDLEQRPAIPVEIRNEVWRRDEGRCVTCGSNDDLLFDLVVPAALGGPTSASNIELRCSTCSAARHQNQARTTVGSDRTRVPAE